MKNLLIQRVTGLIAVVAILACLASLLPVRNAFGAGAPPTISDILDQNIFEDNVTGNIPFTVNDDDIPVDSLIITAISSNQTLVPDANISLGGSGTARTINLIPAGNENGTTLITVTVDDGDLIATDTFTLTVTAVNDEPSFAMGSDVTVPEDSGLYSVAWATGISAGPPDEITQTLAFSVTNDNNPLFSVNPSIAADGTLAFIPAPDANGSATVTVNSLQDNGGVANGGDDTYVPAINTFTITILAVNDAPVANNDSYGGIEEDRGEIYFNPAFGLLRNDTDIDNLPNQLIAIKDTNPANGVLIDFSDNGSFRYQPNPNFCGTDTFTYHASDGLANSNIATVTLNITCINDEPDFTAANPPAVNEDSGLQSVANWATFDAGPSNEDVTQAVSAYIISNSSCGGALLTADPSVDTSGTLTYTPTPEQYGTCTFDILVQDNGGTANGGDDTGPIHTYTITVNQVNDQPNFTASNPPTVDEDAGPQVVSNWATNFDPGPNESGQSVLAYIISNSTCNTLISSGPQVDATGTLTYTPAKDQFGTCTFDAQVRDNGGTAYGGIDTSPTYTFTITVSSVNDLPTISNIPNQLTQANTATSNIAFTIGDVETPAPSLVVTATSSNVTLVPDANIILGGSGTNRTINITPEPNQTGTTTITVTVEDADNATASDTFILTVNTQPTISNISDQVTNEDFATADIPFTIGDIETPAILLTVTATSSNTMLVPDGKITLGGSGTNRTIKVTPAANKYGTTTITVKVQDPNGGIIDDTFVLTVTPVNDEPDFTASNPIANEDSGAQSVIGWVTNFNPGPNEASQQVLAYTVSNSTCGTLLSVGLSVANNGTLTFTPAPNKNGSCNFQVQVQDNGGIINGGDDTGPVHLFTLTINSVNDAPNFTASEPPTINEDSSPQSVANWATFDAGPDDEDLTQTVNAYLVSNLGGTCNTLLLAGPTVTTDGTLNYTPAPNQNGSCTFQVQVQDTGGTAYGGIDLSANKQFTIVVGNINDPPVVFNDIIPNNPEDVVYVIPFNLLTANDSKGNENEASQGLIVTNVISQTGGFVTIDSVGQAVIFTPYPNYNGPASFQYNVRDDGTTNGVPDPKSSDGYAYVNFTITPVNDPPSFLASNPPAVNEDASKQTISLWATYDAGPDDEDSAQQVLQYVIVNTTCANLLSEGPSITSNGTLTYTPLKDANGTCAFTARVLDNGNSVPPHPLDNNMSQSKSFTITVGEVNDEPSFLDAGDVVVAEDQGCYTQTSWATAISAGPPNESLQMLTWNITVSNPGLFSTKPALDQNGTLTFCLAPNKNGSTTARVSLTDNGGTSSGGINTSSIHIFTITVTPVNDRPVAVDDNYSTAVNESVNDSVLNNDYDIDNIVTDFVVSLVEKPTNGELALNSNGAFTYTPYLNFAGKDTFTYSIYDGKSQSNIATVTITVIPKSDEFLHPWSVAKEYRWVKVRSGVSTDLACSETEKGIVITLRTTGDGIVTSCMPGNIARLYQLVESNLPEKLPSRFSYASGFRSEILQQNKLLEVLPGWLRISFVIPDETLSYTILYWDTETETWFEIPPATIVTGQGDAYRYDEERKVIIGVRTFKSYNRIEAVVNFTGIFILVEK